MKKLSHFLQNTIFNQKSSKTIKYIKNYLSPINTMITGRINKSETVPFSANVSHFLQTAENGTL
jgi:hypothetical protein